MNVSSVNNQTTKLNSPLSLISLQLEQNDSVEFNTIHEIAKKNYKSRILLFLVLSLTIMLVPILLNNQFRITGTIAYVTLIILIFLLVVFSKFTIGKNYPFINPQHYTWFVFLQKRNIKGITKFNLYRYARSYIKKTNPEAPHYLSSVYSNEELNLLENPKSGEQQKISQKILRLLIGDWYQFEKPRPMFTHNKQINRIWRLGYIAIGLMFATMIWLFIFAIFNEAEPVFYFVFAGMTMVLIYFYRGFKKEIRRRSNIVTPDIIKQILVNENISVPSNGLFITFRNYVDKNFPYIEI